MNRKSRQVWLLGTFFLAIGLPQAKAIDRCLDLFEAAGIRGFQGEPWSRKPTVAFQTFLPGQHGGRRILVKRTGPFWGSRYEKDAGAVQGDPRSFVRVFGEEVAAYLGYEILSDEEMILPDAKEFNAALAKLNRKLQRMGREPIAIDFYQVKEEVGPTIYLGKVTEKAKSVGLPMAIKGISMVHDSAFHTRAILIPRYILDRLAQQTQEVLRFSRFLDQIIAGEIPNPTKLNQEQLRHAKKMIQMAKVHDVDFATANLSVAAIDFLAHDVSRQAIHEALSQVIHTRLYSGHGPLTALSRLMRKGRRHFNVRMLIRNMTTYRRRVWWWPKKVPLSRSYLDWLYHGIQPAFDQYFKASTSPIEPPDLRFRVDVICEAMAQKRLEIVEAVRSILAESGSK